MHALRITEFTDPGCPFAFSAEPARRRVRWMYGEQIAWDLRVVVLARSGAEYERRGFTTEVQEQGFTRLAAEHGMPIDGGRRPRMAGTLAACRAVVAARRHEGAAVARGLLRAIAVEGFGGGLLDDPETIAAGARAAGLDPAALAAWAREEATEEAVAADMEAARTPTAAALAQPERLSDAGDGRLRYTCPSYEIERVTDGVAMSVPGFQPFRSYEVAIANLAPGLVRRDPPADPAAVIADAGEPLGTAEIAAVMDTGLDEAREACRRAGLAFRPVGPDGYWSAAAA